MEDTTMIEIETIALRDDPLLIERLAREHDRADRAAARVLGAVAHYYRLSPAALTGRGRTGEVAEARQMVMYLMRQGIRWAMARRDADGAFHLAMEPYPYEQIAHHLGRDHSTVMHGWRVIARRRRACKDVAYTVRALIAELSRPSRRTAA